MFDAANRDWVLYINDMIDFAEKVISYSQGLDQIAFSERGITYDALLRNLELIGEAATHIAVEVRESNEQVPWRLIIATRNRLIHGYLGIDDETLWSIITTDVVALLPKLKELRDGER